MAARLLCIDDEAEVRQLVVDMLGLRGFTVDVAANANEGFTGILHNPPDLVLCDILMPEESGFDLLERLSSLSCDHLGPIPFIFLTALADRETILKGRRLGADDYVTKPIDFDILVEVIKARLGPPGLLGRRLERPLTRREAEVLSWAAHGKTSVDIAALLDIGERTVDFHLGNAMHKLGVSTRAQAVMKATLHRLIRL
ncbi:MAG: response regulator transcription factor [Alphaproteobacteria bacterium]|nr:response regulator transcription factor [Alphaproteobacteria bacterium]